MLSYLVRPGTSWLVCGVIILCLPLIWRVRMRSPAQSVLKIDVGVMVWSLRALGIAFGIGSIVLALTNGGAMMLDAMFMLGSASVGVFLAVPLARIMLGSSAMNVSEQERRRYWQVSRSLGIGYLAMSVLTYLLFDHPR